MSNLSQPFVSVVIPVFNDNERLQTCLEALEDQTYPKNLYEVIVVDNGSAASIQSVVEQFKQAFATYENRPGSYAARNKGLTLTKGEVVAFTDADCIPASDWIERGVANLQSVPECGLVAGKIKLFFKEPDHPTAAELYESIMVLQQKFFLEVRNYGATANVFTFKSVIDKVGPFDEKIRSGADLEWGQRVFGAGYKQLYADDACVAHPTRRTFREVYKRTIRLAGGFHDRDRKKARPVIAIAVELVTQLKPPLMTIIRIYNHGSLNGFSQKTKVAFITTIVKYLRIWERTRLLLGGEPQR